jgi:hypothetical protein
VLNRGGSRGGAGGADAASGGVPSWVAGDANSDTNMRHGEHGSPPFLKRKARGGTNSAVRGTGESRGGADRFRRNGGVRLCASISVRCVVGSGRAFAGQILRNFFSLLYKLRIAGSENKNANFPGL